MARVLQSTAMALLVAPMTASLVYAQNAVQVDGHNQFSQYSGSGSAASTPFEFNTNDIESITYSRLHEDQTMRYADRQTEFSLSVKPARPEFSLEGGFGLNMIGDATKRLAVESGLLGRNRLVEAIPDLHDGLSYSAGIKVEHEDADIDGTAYVSSSQLGLSYGRLGQVWYGGLDVNLEQYSDDYHGDDQPDVLKLDFTTGLRLGITGLSASSPLWLLSLQGNFDVHKDGWDEFENNSDWYLNPSLFWQNPGFTFSAQVQLPVEAPSSDGDEEPDYRLRAVFEKQFR